MTISRDMFSRHAPARYGHPCPDYCQRGDGVTCADDECDIAIGVFPEHGTVCARCNETLHEGELCDDAGCPLGGKVSVVHGECQKSEEGK